MAQRDLRHVDAGSLGEPREHLAAGVGLGGRERLAFDVLRVLDRALSEHDAVLHHVPQHKERGNGRRRVRGGEARHRAEIAETDVVGALRNARHGLIGAGTAIDLHVQAFGCVKALFDRQQEVRLRAPEIDVEREAHAGARLGEGGGRQLELRCGGRTGEAEAEGAACNLPGHAWFAFRSMGSDGRRRESGVIPWRPIKQTQGQPNSGPNSYT